MFSVTRVDWDNCDTGDVGFLWGTSLVSRIIEIWEAVGGTPGDPSHVFLVVSNRQDDRTLLEAAWPHVRLASLDEYRGQKTCLFRPLVAAERRHAAMDRVIHRYRNRRYDVPGVLAFAAIEPLRRLGWRRVPNLLASRRRLWCSELACRYLQFLLEEDFPLSPRLTDPAMLFQWMESHVATSPTSDRATLPLSSSPA